MKSIRFLDEAFGEMMNSAAYYEIQQTDMGKRFLSAVQEAINHIQISPGIYPFIHGNVQRCITKTFPFNVLFRELPEEIIIFAVMHQRQKPDYWIDR